ncbi:protein-L-isoaspartate(D-aspartate) O-methyltransferase [Cupriavidus plantarum]|uniref:protein-L-isoaspartate(D-aspartate) O-methyltransferase n=1 Tax=Cupriavidus plantarum TaxID=942865 RepID=UPI000F1B6DD6|nr:protein-L-isoaspartate(D-aspartate) O-methyltransferase [Cupriavidus plantarum]NYI01079.1 protein-L-isoaspartate(D-aspartate) O-methyltransferase [Cupriavidus plantarum]RLK39353.1 protein-L-isoaspartate(D-aspartate) O-methyltransferase [Cupriavidus plantarum]
MSTLDERRGRMVEWQLERRGIRDAAVLRAMNEVPRERFVAAELLDSAYDDAPLRIGAGQTISQPYIVARMIEALRLTPRSRVLEIGAGSGYAAAVMARIAAHVTTLERHPRLADTARDCLRSLAVANVAVHAADGTLGWPDDAPYDAIVAAAGGPRVPDAWLEQLAPHGTLVMPLGDTLTRQELVRLTRDDGGGLRRDNLGAVVFVPLVGAQGWRAGADSEVVS